MSINPFQTTAECLYLGGGLDPEQQTDCHFICSVKKVYTSLNKRDPSYPPNKTRVLSMTTTLCPCLALGSRPLVPGWIL